jgi:hypothetical protein
MQMKLTCDLILICGKGPKERDTRRFTCQKKEAGRSEARLDRPGLRDQTLVMYRLV